MKFFFPVRPEETEGREGYFRTLRPLHELYLLVTGKGECEAAAVSCKTWKTQ